MCGITGIYSTRGAVSPGLISAMTDAIMHRGPDDGGFFCDGPVAIGNRRLAIIDLSPGGHQPMAFSEGEMWMVYNGEVYNFIELRTELEAKGYEFSTKSDTEVVLKAFHAWGTDAFTRLRGMYAIAIWDRRIQTLTLARDPFGIKPLYIAECGADIVFGSELKSLRLHPEFPKEINASSFSFYLSHLYVPEPHSIYAKVERLPQGHWMKLGPNGRTTGNFYNPEVPAAASKRSYDETVEELIHVMEESVKVHLVADVPVGVFLSGGVDSSIVVAMMRRAGVDNIKTFTIGFEGAFASYDERHYANIIAKHFQTDHQEIIVQPSVVSLLEDRLVQKFDEPFANPAALIADVLSEFTRTKVTVALSGVGADEFFAGYPRYQGMVFMDKLQRVPDWMIKTAQRALSAMPNSPDRRNWIERARRLFNAANVPASSQYEALTRFTGDLQIQSLLSPDMARKVNGTSVLPGITASDGHLLEQLLQLDRETYLPGDLLTYTDRASMTHSLEVRTPFCDIVVDKFARTVPASYKIRRNELKYILKDGFKSIVPPEVMFRPKKGFSVPIGEWLLGPLKPMLHDLLSIENLNRQPYIEPKRARDILKAFEAGEHQYAFLLWAILIFLLWNSRINSIG